MKGRPPRNAQARFEAYLQQQGETNAVPQLASKELLRFYVFYQHFEEAAKFLRSLEKQGQLPGFSKGELAEIWPAISDTECDCEPYPTSRTFSCKKSGDASAYHYIVVRESKDAPWKLQEAWRTGPDGRVIEDYSVQ